MPPKTKKSAADVIAMFQKLNLHESADEEPDNEKKPWILTAKVKESHGKEIYGCSFNQYADPEDDQYLATGGSEFLHIYRFPKDSNEIVPVWTCSFPVIKPSSPRKTDRSESIYSVTWAYDTYDHSIGKNPWKVLCGGALGTIYVIDFLTRKLDNHLKSSGSDINDIRMSPVDSNIVASANSDSSIRIHHIRNESCLFVIGGTKHCHSGTVLSLDWHYLSNYILSSGFDHQVLRWDMSTSAVKNHMERACETLKKGKRNVLSQYDNERKPPKVAETSFGPEALNEVRNNFSENQNGGVYPIYVPSGHASDIHNDYVDCIRILPETDYILSKSTASEKSIFFWRFGVPEGEENHLQKDLHSEKSTMNMIQRHVPRGDPYFLKFDIDPRGRWLVCGGALGEVYLYDLNDIRVDQKPRETLSVSTGYNSACRQITFSPCGRFFAATTDDSFVYRFDRVHASVNQTELRKFAPSERK